MTPSRGRAAPRRRARPLLGPALVATALLVAACSSSSDDEAAPTSASTTTQAGGGGPTTTAAPAAPAEPTRLDVADLAAMTLPQAELGAVASGLEFDWFYGGFESNEERARDKSDDHDAELADLERTGRLGGYQNMYVPPEAASGERPAGVQRVYTYVGLFRDAGGAAAYLADATQESAAQVGRPSTDGGPTMTSRTDFATEGIGDESVGAVSRGGADVVTAVSFRRGRILASATVYRTDRNDDRADVVRMARAVDQRIQEVLRGSRRGYAGLPGGEVTIDELTAMPLPQAQLPARYTRYGENMFASGFLDNEERSEVNSFDPADDRADDQRFGRIVGYAGAWSSDFSDPPPATRGWASNGVDLFADASSASQWLADTVQDEHRQVGRTGEQLRITAVDDFAVTGVADEAVGFVRRTTRGDEVDVLFRRGRLVGTVALGPPGGDERRSEATALARALDERIVSMLASAAS